MKISDKSTNSEIKINAIWLNYNCFSITNNFGKKS